MTDAQKISMVQTMTGEEDEDVISAYLYMAGRKICSIAYPYDDVEEVPARYEHIQIDATVYLLNKRGAEGETSHGENGISRSYENADLPVSMLRSVAPMCKVVT